MKESVADVSRLPIAYCTLLAEFDIDTGSCLRARYPLKSSPVSGEIITGEGNTLSGMGRSEEEIAQEEEEQQQQQAFELDESYCASHMLPDGAEKQVVSRTVFIVNRPKPVMIERVPIYYFTAVAAAASSPNKTDVNTGDISLLSSESHFKWIRDTKVDNTFLHDELQFIKTTRELFLRKKGSVKIESIALKQPQMLLLSSTLPHSINNFVQQLQVKLLQNEVEVVERGSPLRIDETSLSRVSKPLNSHHSGYSFAIIRTDTNYYGFLVQSTYLERFNSLMNVFSTASEEEKEEKKEEKVTSHSTNYVVPPLYGLCAVVTRKDASVRRGGISKSVAILGPKLVWLEPFFPLLVETALQCCDVKGKTEEAVEKQTALLRRCFDSVAFAKVPLREGLSKVKDFLEMEVIRLSTRSPKTSHILYTTSPFGTSHSIHIPVLPESYDFTFSRYGLERMVEICGSSFWFVVMAIILEKRIVVLSRQGLPNDVCEAVLSLGLIGDLLDPHFTTTKVFPYTSVNGFLHFSNIPGYIVGTLNPIFETQQAWWDVLCDLDNKTVIVSPEGWNGIINNNNNNNSNNSNNNNKASNLSVDDVQFFKDIINKVYRMKALGESLCEQHTAVRLMIEEYIGLMIMIGDEANEIKRHELSHIIQNIFLAPNITRIRVRAQSEYMIQDMPENFLLLGEDPFLLFSVATLRRASSCDEVELLQALHFLLDCVQTCKEVLLLLRRMPRALDGLNPLAAQLLHPSLQVRSTALELLRRLEVMQVGRDAIAAMNTFMYMVYEEASKKM
ncbi:uncharacterized protein TM35_000072220 [Trypanosoma theileri]|uniref:Arf3-interacting protein 1 N-terminal domain-containing protein n=1 Tax=Trypanosoma theileri TaxID=67003 RepID=A0A1X0P1T6_9TRYP|nr:uncharacterized protein TM35_000072220 [Trypanosoma theileri]ORC90798.1 hypothetical protein TM35_000072220 [Trypanosoma theileri]